MSLAGCLLKTFVGRIHSFYSGSIIDNFEFPLALNIFSMAMCLERQIVNKHIPRLLMSIDSGKRCSIKFNQKRSTSEMTGRQTRKITCQIKTRRVLISDNSYPGKLRCLYFLDMWSVFEILFKMDFTFESRFRFTAKLSREQNERSHIPTLLTLHTNSFLHHQHPTPEWYIFVTADEPTLIHHHPMPIVYSGVRGDGVESLWSGVTEFGF